MTGDRSWGTRGLERDLIGYEKGVWLLTQIPILNVTTWLSLRLHDVVTLLGEVLDEHFLRGN